MMNKNLITPAINDIPVAAWGAEMLEPEIGPCEYSNGYLKAPGKLFPVMLKPTIGLRELTLTFDFAGGSPYETAMHISNLTDTLQQGADILLPDGFYYWCVFDSAGTPSRVAPWIEQVVFTLRGVRHGRMEEVLLTESDQLNIDGNLETPVIAELTPSGSTMSFMGITISGTAKAIIDGLNTTVKDEDGNNVFGKTDMTKWPSFTPGENAVEMDGVLLAKISYYPLWK